MKKLDAEYGKKIAAEHTTKDAQRPNTTALIVDENSQDQDTSADPKAPPRPTQPQLKAAHHIQTDAIQQALVRSNISEVKVVTIVELRNANCLKLAHDRTLSNDISIGKTALAKKLKALLDPTCKGYF